MSYHFNPATGKSGVCHATGKRGCPLAKQYSGGQAPHFESKQEADAFGEKVIEAQQKFSGNSEVHTISKDKGSESRSAGTKDTKATETSESKDKPSQGDTGKEIPEAKNNVTSYGPKLPNKSEDEVKNMSETEFAKHMSGLKRRITLSGSRITKLYDKSFQHEQELENGNYKGKEIQHKTEAHTIDQDIRQEESFCYGAGKQEITDYATRNNLNVSPADVASFADTRRTSAINKSREKLFEKKESEAKTKMEKARTYEEAEKWRIIHSNMRAVTSDARNTYQRADTHIHNLMSKIHRENDKK